MEPNLELFKGLAEADPRRLSREMSGLLSVDAVKDGNGPPVLLYKNSGKTYVVEVRLWDVTGVPFYRRAGLVERLNELRKALGEKLDLFTGEKPRSLKQIEELNELESRQKTVRAPRKSRPNAKS